MIRLVIVVVVVAIVAVAVIVARRRPTDPPTGTGRLPQQVDRADFDRPDADWLIAVFTDESCLACREALEAARPLAGPPVAVQEIELARSPALHRRYAIDSVPLLLVADRAGVVRSTFLGPPGASRLWGVMAELRADE